MSEQDRCDIYNEATPSDSTVRFFIPERPGENMGRTLGPAEVDDDEGVAMVWVRPATPVGVDQHLPISHVSTALAGDS